MDDFNNNSAPGNEQQNTPGSSGNSQGTNPSGNDAQRANSGSPYNGGCQPNNGYPYSSGNGGNSGNGYYGENGAYSPNSTYSGNNSYVYYGNSNQPPKKPVDRQLNRYDKRHTHGFLYRQERQSYRGRRLR